jgi:hypothetical protein
MVDRLTVRAALVSEDLLLMIKPQESRAMPASPKPGIAPQTPSTPAASSQTAVPSPAAPAPGIPRKPVIPQIPAPSPAPSTSQMDF